MKCHRIWCTIDIRGLKRSLAEEVLVHSSDSFNFFRDYPLGSLLLRSFFCMRFRGSFTFPTYLFQASRDRSSDMVGKKGTEESNNAWSG